MTGISVIVPLREAAEAAAEQLDELGPVLDRLDPTHEILIVADGSSAAVLAALKLLLDAHPRLRLLHIEQPSGTSIALTAGIAAARGNVLVAIEAGRRYPPAQIGTLVGHLARGDLVFGRPRRRGWAKARHRIARIPRWLLLGLLVRDPDCLFWAARREAIAGIALTRGMHRHLPTLVTMRGYRVSEVPVETRPEPRRTHDPDVRLGDLLAAWWLQYRWSEPQVREILPERIGQPPLKIAQGTIEVGRPTHTADAQAPHPEPQHRRRVG